MQFEPQEAFRGTVLIIAPHMDDEILACGGTIARIPDKEKIQVVYATDGMKSPSPIIPWRDSITPDLGEVRINESKAAMKYMGVPDANLHFLKLPESGLRKHIPSLRSRLLELIERINPDYILIPFRYDRHPDHLAVNHVVTAAYDKGINPQPQLYEYFVYYRWRLLPTKDIRHYITPKYLLEVDISAESALKEKALNCFESQTTIYYSWQTRPILTKKLIGEESRRPEFFIRYDPTLAGASIFSNAAMWIRIVHRLEPFLQRWKYRVGAVLSRGLVRDGNRAKQT